VPDDGYVFRLIPVGSCDVVDGQWEFQSGAFDNASPLSDDESSLDMSVALGDALEALGRLPEHLPIETPCAGRPELWGVAMLQIGYLRNKEDQEILRTRQDDELAHGDVRGVKNTKRRRRLKKHAKWVIRPALQPQ
jgi:hypothetical protein